MKKVDLYYFVQFKVNKDNSMIQTSTQYTTQQYFKLQF